MPIPPKIPPAAQPAVPTVASDGFEVVREADDRPRGVPAHVCFGFFFFSFFFLIVC